MYHFPALNTQKSRLPFSRLLLSDFAPPHTSHCHACRCHFQLSGHRGTFTCTEWRCAMDNQATTPLGYCPNMAFLPVCPLCANARRNRCSFPFGELEETIRCPRTALLHGWRLFNKTWNPVTSPWMKQWLRIIHSDLVLHIPSGACQKWWWCGSDGWRCFALSSSWDFSASMKQSLLVHRSHGTPTQLVVAVLITGERRCHSTSS